MNVTQAAQSSTSAQTTSGRQQLATNFDTFLKLLTTQLQYQDPTEPLDTNQFTTQLVQYSQVEQQINTNKNLEALLSLNQSASAGTALSYLGKSVVMKSATTTLSDGAANWNYELPSNSTGTQLVITDSAGKIVRTLPGETLAGKHALSWDGKSNTGADLPNGAYRLEVKADSASGSKLSALITTSGVVSEAEVTGSAPTLKVGAHTVTLSDIISVRTN
ncbi:MAG TPA: hypothetical protein DCL54_04530 [Alphaproteobacteria bacterium]|nr:hypothetical protein [Alphaproteobacteria bacterium]HAJ45831.1 hypothetical protein [Alphaproteobacteria bacterium]